LLHADRARYISAVVDKAVILVLSLSGGIVVTAAYLVISAYQLLTAAIDQTLPWWRHKDRVTTCLENLEMSGNLTAVREMQGFY